MTAIGEAVVTTEAIGAATGEAETVTEEVRMVTEEARMVTGEAEMVTGEVGMVTVAAGMVTGVVEGEGDVVHVEAAEGEARRSTGSIVRQKMKIRQSWRRARMKPDKVCNPNCHMTMTSMKQG